jgi:acetyltransferase EpsM
LETTSPAKKAIFRFVTGMLAKLIIVGGGEHARVVAQVARSHPDQWHIEGFVDIRSCHQTQAEMGLRRLGQDEDLEPLLRQDLSRMLVLGVGKVPGSDLRREIVQRIAISKERWASVIDASARVYSGVGIGNGVVVMPGAMVNCGASLGDHCIINTGAIVEHDVQVGEFVQVAPGAVIGGGAVLEHDSYVGLGARVRDHVVIASGATVAMGGVVVSHVAAGCTVMGVPAKVKVK